MLIWLPQTMGNGSHDESLPHLPRKVANQFSLLVLLIRLQRRQVEREQSVSLGSRQTVRAILHAFNDPFFVSHRQIIKRTGREMQSVSHGGGHLIINFLFQGHRVSVVLVGLPSAHDKAL